MQQPACCWPVSANPWKQCRCPNPHRQHSERANQAFSAELSRALEGRELLVSTDLRQTSRCATQLLLTSQGVATRIQLSQLRQMLALQGTPMAGWVLLDPDLHLG